MAIAITKRGNDQNVLSQVLTDGNIVSSYNGNTQLAVEKAAIAAGVALAYYGNDLNMIERLATAAAPVYVFALDDDGTLAAAMGRAWLPTIAPDYMHFSQVLEETGIQGYTAATSKIFNDDGSFPLRAGKVVVVAEYEVTAAPAPALIQTHGIFVAITDAGAAVGIVTAGFENGGGGLNTYANPNGGGAGNTLLTAVGAASLVGQRIGLYVDSDTGAMGMVTSEAGDLGAIGGAAVIAAGRRFSPGLFINDDAAAGATAGKTLAGRLYINAADLTLAYPAGAVDCYGVAL